MVVEESIHVEFDEFIDSLQRRESVDDDVGLDSMGRLQIENGIYQQEEEIDSNKEEKSPWPLFHLFNLSKENLVKDFQESANLLQIIHKIKL